MGAGGLGGGVPQGSDENTVQPNGPDKLDPLWHPISGRGEEEV